jgi:hypothetical protein
MVSASNIAVRTSVIGGKQVDVVSWHKNLSTSHRQYSVVVQHRRDGYHHIDRDRSGDDLAVHLVN